MTTSDTKPSAHTLNTKPDRSLTMDPQNTLSITATTPKVPFFASPQTLLLDLLLKGLDVCDGALELRRPLRPRRVVGIPFDRFGLPYALAPVDTGRLIVLNRAYKPLGLALEHGSWVDYSDFPAWVVPAEIGQIAADAFTKSSDGYHWLYADGTAPWRGIQQLRDYTERLMSLIDALRKSGVAR